MKKILMSLITVNSSQMNKNKFWQTKITQIRLPSYKLLKFPLSCYSVIGCMDLRLQVLEEPVDGALVEQQALDPLHHGAPSGQLVGPAARGASPARHAAPRAALGARHNGRCKDDWSRETPRDDKLCHWLDAVWSKVDECRRDKSSFPISDFRTHCFKFDDIRYLFTYVRRWQEDWWLLLLTWCCVVKGWWSSKLRSQSSLDLRLDASKHSAVQNSANLMCDTFSYKL